MHYNRHMSDRPDTVFPSTLTVGRVPEVST